MLVQTSPPLRVLLNVAIALAALPQPAAGQQAQDRYAAIAYSPATGRYGYCSQHAGRLEDAKACALKQVNAADARVVIWARNAWCALARGDNGAYGYAWG